MHHLQVLLVVMLLAACAVEPTDDTCLLAPGSYPYELVDHSGTCPAEVVTAVTGEPYTLDTQDELYCGAVVLEGADDDTCAVTLDGLLYFDAAGVTDGFVAITIDCDGWSCQQVFTAIAPP